MKRRATESAMLQRRKKLYARFVTSHRSLDQPGRFRKMHPLDCGKVQCRVCHYNKYPKRELHEHEVKADVAWAEQMKEMRE